MSQVTIKRDFKKHTYSFVFGATDESVEVDIDPALGIRGEVVKLILTIPNWTNAVTAVVSMINADVKEVYADGTPRARNDEYSITVARNACIVVGQAGEKFKVTLSGAPGGTGGTMTVTAYVEG